MDEEGWDGTYVVELSHGKEGNPATYGNMMDLEGLMPSEISQTENKKYCVISLICGI